MNKIKHWLVVLVSCLMAASSIGICINAVGVFYTPVSDSLGIMRGTFAMHATLSMILTAIMALFITKLQHKIHFKWLLLVGALLAGGSTYLMAYSTNIIHFYILGALKGVGAGLYSGVTLTMIINYWFVKHHGLATSIVLSFSGLAGAIGSPLFAWCIQQFSWQKAYMIMGIIIILLCVPALVLPFQMDPRKEGLQPYGYIKEDKKEVSSISKTKIKFNFLSISFICFATFSILHTAITGVTQHLPGFAETLGHNTTIGATMLSAGMIGNILSKLMIGFISDRLGPIKASIIMIIINMISIIMLLTLSTSFMLILGSLLFGSAYSVAAVGFPLLTREFFGQENFQKVYPVISFATGFGGAFALSLVGYIYDFTGSYNVAFMIAFIIHLINIVLISMILWKKRKLLR